MGLNKKEALFHGFYCLALLLLLASGCAVQQKPQGGPKDVTPPKLLKATPSNLTRHFSAKQIQLDFDEYVRLTNPFQEITIFPVPDKRPDFKIKQKSLTITLKDSLQKNTTYVINFGNAIGDVHEGNRLKNFSYVFSTGSHIDSLSLSGSVINVLTQQKEKDATVMLFTLKQDSLLFGKKKPTNNYVTTDTAGNFTINNLKEGDYKLYALKEKQPDKIYNDNDELIAFSNKTIHVSHDSSGIKLTLFKQIPEKLRPLEHKFNPDGSMFFVFNKPIANPSVHIVYPADLDAQKIVDISKTRDTISVYSKNMDFDSVSFVFYDKNKPVDTTYLHKTRKELFNGILTLNYNLSRNQNALKPGIDLELTASTPIASFDPQLIALKEDTSYVNFTLLKDSINTKHFIIKHRWLPRAEYNLTVNEGAFTSIYGTKNKKQTKPFLIIKPDDYSTFSLTFNVPDTSRSYLVELLSEQKILLRSDYITKKTTINYKDLYIGTYFIRVVYDDNRNGKWDPGSLKQRSQPDKQPENIWLDTKSFTTKAKWILNETIDIPPETINP